MSTGRLRLDKTDLARLTELAAALGIRLEPGTVDRFARYADLLSVWSARTNLISCADGNELVERHLADSLVAAALLQDARVVVDLGSGAGLPGVPLAITHPNVRFTLVESRRRRASFLHEVRRQVAENVEVLERRAERSEGPPERLGDVVVSRAVWSGDAILDIAGNWLRVGGRLIWMRGVGARVVPDTARLRRRMLIPYRVGTVQSGSLHVFERTDGA